MKEQNQTPPNASNVDATAPNTQTEIVEAAISLFKELDIDVLNHLIIDYARVCNDRGLLVKEDFFYLHSQIESFYQSMKPLV